MPDVSDLCVAMISSYVPRQCGLATFTNDLGTALSEEAFGQSMQSGRINIIAMNDRDGEYTYGLEVAGEIRQHRKEDYRNAADVLNNSKVDVVSLQHEYGLFGGADGEYLFGLLERLRKPLITTLHTILSEPSPGQLDVLRRVCEHSGAVVVMAQRARKILSEVYGVDPDRIRLIHHGVPDVPFGDTEPFKERFGVSGRPVILTFGLLSASKGIETMLDALGRVAPEHPDVAYIVLGVTHPAVRRESGESYRLSLERRAVELGIQKNVLFHNRYVSLDDLREYLQAADLYVTPYRAKEQITSGTLAYAVASGRAVISTPYWHAEELLADGRGRLVDFGDIDGLARELGDLLKNTDQRETIRKAAHDFGREMVWARVAGQYAQTFDDVRRAFAERESQKVPGVPASMRLSLPEPRLDHLYAMSDDTGMLQHAIFGTPDRHHGYTTDDNARALIVTAMAWSLFKDERVLDYLHSYLSFLHFAQVPDIGRFRNFMSYDRRWLESDGSDDSQGRALWALGYLISHAPNHAMKKLATDLFRRAVPKIAGLRFPRSWALSILGLHYYLREFTDDIEIRHLMGTLGERLNDRFIEHASEDWPWFEDVVTYDNGRIPQALIIAGLGLDRQHLVDRGLKALEWLFVVQTSGEGYLSPIGNDGWLTRNGKRAVFDQQPLEAAGLIGACKAAYRASGSNTWLREMRRSFEWYLGRNAVGLQLVDFKTRGCHDGLEEHRLNENQGAESLLSWLLSLLIMHEMQTGEAPEVA